MEQTIKRIAELQLQYSPKATSAMKERGELVKKTLPKELQEVLDPLGKQYKDYKFDISGYDGIRRKATIPNIKFTVFHKDLGECNYHLTLYFSESGERIYVTVGTDALRHNWPKKRIEDKSILKVMQEILKAHKILAKDKKDWSKIFEDKLELSSKPTPSRPDSYEASTVVAKMYFIQNFELDKFCGSLARAFECLMHLISHSEKELSETTKKSFEDYLLRSNKTGSGKASSYIRALSLLEQMLDRQPHGLEHCRDLWAVESVSKLHELYELVLKQAKQPKQSGWVFDDIPGSYLEKGFCSAGLRAYIEFRSSFEVQPQLFCQLALHYLLGEREKSFSEHGPGNDFHTFFTGENEKYSFDKLKCFKLDDPGQADFKEITKDLKFLLGEVFPYLSSLNRLAPQVASFFNSSAFSVGNDLSIYVYPYLDCIKGLQSLEVSEDCKLVPFLSSLINAHNDFNTEGFASSGLIKFACESALKEAGPDSTVYDPACGIGAVLICALDQISGIRDLYQISGSEINPVLANIAKAGFLLKAFTIRDKLDPVVLNDLIFRVSPNIRIEDSLKSNQQVIRDLSEHWSSYNELLMYPPYRGDHVNKYDYIITEPPQDGAGLNETFLKLDHQQFLLFCASRNIQAQQSLLILSESIRRSERDGQLRDLMIRNFPPTAIYHANAEKKVIIHFEEFRPDKLTFGDIADNNNSSAENVPLEISNLITASKDEIVSGNRELVFSRETKTENESTKVSFEKARQYFEFQIDKFNNLLIESRQIHDEIENTKQEYQPERKLAEYLPEGQGWLDVSGSSLKGLDLGLMDQDQSKSEKVVVIEVFSNRTKLKLEKKRDPMEHFYREDLGTTPPYQIYFLQSEKEKIEPNFLYYWIRAQLSSKIEEQLRRKSIVEVPVRVDFLMHEICNQKITIPPFYLQGTIAKFLRKLFPLAGIFGLKMGSRTSSSRTPHIVDMIRYLLCL